MTFPIRLHYIYASSVFKLIRHVEQNVTKFSLGSIFDGNINFRFLPFLVSANSTPYHPSINSVNNHVYMLSDMLCILEVLVSQAISVSSTSFS